MGNRYPNRANPQKFCIFCGANADSKEHFWPTWLHPLIATNKPNQRHARRAYQFHPSTGERESGPTDRPGGVHTVRIRAVCKTCNSGWMNRIEASARPHLTALATASHAVFGETELGVIARWITLKCIVAEHAIPNNAVTPQTDRTAFMNEGTIPDYFRVYVARNVSEHDIGYIRHSHCVALSTEGPAPPLNGAAQNIQTVSFLMGKAFIHVNAVRIADFDFESRIMVIPVWDRCRFWPPQIAPVLWPRRPNLDSDGIDFVASVLERYISSSRTTWADSPLT